ncbi:MAG TPA: metallophosphoesterase [Gemmatimonadaceae bacterium]|nr:metallophosphoesterase [Gemmatimonadaceae bacterium]
MLRFALYLAATWGTLLALTVGLPGWAVLAVATVALYTLLPIALFVRWRGWPFYPSAAFRLLVVRPALYAQLLLPLGAAGGLLGLLVGAFFGEALLVGRAVAGAVLAVGSLILVAGYLGSRSLRVRETEAQVRDLPAELDGLRIVQISDVHVGPHTSSRFLERVVRAVETLRPDLVAVTGDLVDDRHEDVAAYARVLGRLRAPAGVFLIPGNHDVYAGWDHVERGLRRLTDATILVNEARVLERGGARFAVVGVGDPAGRDGAAAPDVERALARVPAGVPVIAFAHNPVLWPRLARRGVALTLSGHTHWGQLALPRLGWSLASPFLEHAMGAHRDGDALLFIHPGTGYWGIPFRLGALPEVTAVVLRAATTTAMVVGERRCAA